jgi:hypothetical protein
VPFTFVKTAIEANELPKLIPTTGGSFETTSASALPFGTVIARDIELGKWLVAKEEKKRCTRQIYDHVRLSKGAKFDNHKLSIIDHHEHSL